MTINPRMLGIMLIAVSVLLVTTGSQDAMATADVDDPEACPPICEPPMDIVSDVDIEEAAEAGNATMTCRSPMFLAIQHAQSGTISEINATAYTLELNDISDKTNLFSERPDRIVRSINTSDFIVNWAIGPDSFAADPPNAAMVFDDDKGMHDLGVVELFNPVYDATAKILKYDIISLNATSIELPTEFGQSTLFIDDPCCDGSRGCPNDCTNIVN